MNELDADEVDFVKNTIASLTNRRAKTMLLLTLAGNTGLTYAELCEKTGWHHGQASGVLSKLHANNDIARLKEMRESRKVYVLNQFINSRAVGVARSVTKCKKGDTHLACPNGCYDRKMTEPEYDTPDHSAGWQPDVQPLYADNPNTEIDPDWFEE